MIESMYTLIVTKSVRIKIVHIIKHFKMTSTNSLKNHAMAITCNVRHSGAPRNYPHAPKYRCTVPFE